MPRGLRTALMLAPVLLALGAAVLVASREAPPLEFPCWVLPKGQVVAIPGADDCPLRFLDQIRKVEMRPGVERRFSDLRREGRSWPLLPEDDARSLRVELRRHGKSEWISVPLRERTRTAVVSRVIGAFAIAAGLMWIPVSLLQRSNAMAAVPLGIFYSSTVVIAIVAAAGESEEIMSRAAVFAFVAAPAALAHLSFAFPVESQTVRHAPELVRLPYLVSGTLALIAAFALDRNPILWRPFLFLTLGLCVAAWGILMMSCYFAVRESEEVVERARARFVFWGTLLLPIIPALLLTWQSSVGELIGAYLWLAAMAMPLPIGLAISHYNLFDLGWDVRRWVARLLYFGSGALASALLVYAGLGFVDPNHSIRDLGVLFGAALSCLVVVEGLRRPLLGFLESMLTPRLDALRELRESYSAEMVELRDEDAATRLLSEVLERGLGARAGSVLLSVGADWRPASLFGEDAPTWLSHVEAAEAVLRQGPIIHLPLQTEEGDLDARLLAREGLELVAQIGSSERLGMVLLASNAREVPYSGVEIDFVSMATAHAANAIQNARLAGELVATERHAATARVAVALMHDIGKDLGWIRRLVSRLPKVEAGTGRFEETVSEIRELTTSVVERMRAFMREATAPRTDPPGVLRLDEMLDSALRRLEQRHGARRIHQSIDPAIRGLRCHENLGRVAANLVENGLHASAPDGVVRVCLSQPDDSSLELTVTDDGCGLAGEVLRRAFEPGFTTRRDCGGTGVGLSVSRDIVEAMGGKIELRQSTGGGTCAFVQVPQGARSRSESSGGAGAKH